MEYKRGDVVWIGDFGCSSDMGSVQKGNRPAIIIQNDTGNTFSNTTIVVYGTTSIKKESQPTHIVIEGGGLRKPTLFMGEQIDTIPISHIKNKMGKLTDAQLSKIDDIVCESLDLYSTNKQIRHELDVYNSLKQYLKPNELALYLQTSIIRLSGTVSSVNEAKNEKLVMFFSKELQILNDKR